MKKLVFAILLFFNAAMAWAQDMLTPVQYIELYKHIAISEMKRMGVPAAITLAQGILETESGNSALVKKSNNHFGIKCKSTWTAGGVSHDDDAIGECFRQYKTAEDSYRDHSNFLRGSDRYGFLFKLDVRDYKGWAHGLKKAGYATNPRYPQILIKNIEQYNLQQYTLLAANETPQFNAGNYQDDKEEKNETPGESVPDINDNVVTVNGSKCVYAGKGTSLLVVAIKNNIALSKLLSFNELDKDGMLTKDQFVYLEKKSTTGNRDFYIANGYESLYDIAQKNGIQIQYMLHYNKLLANEDIEAGRKIYLKPDSNNIRVATTVINAKTHIVQPKEGLYAIARKYNVTVQQLKEWNKLQTNSLSIGQQLIIAK
jgi:LysM repeat protein